LIGDLHDAADGHVFKADLCIVGAGPAGIALAESLSGSGLHTLLLESGGLKLGNRLGHLNRADIVGQRFTGDTEGRARVFGGAGRLWAGQCLRLDPIDFEKRDWIPDSGWPIGMADLDGYYTQAEAFFDVAGQPTDGSAYGIFGQAPPPWPPGTVDSMFTVYTRDIDIGRLHRVRLAAAKDVQVVLNATAVHIDTADRRVSGIDIRGADGRVARAEARAYVLCTGGIENARLLLASNRQRSGGLGNSRDLVGRFLQDHPNGFTARLSGGNSVDLRKQFRILMGERRFFPKMRLSAAAQRTHRVANANAHLTFDDEPGTGMAALRAFLAAARRARLPDHALTQALPVLRDSGVIAKHALSRLSRGALAPPPSTVRLQCYLEQAPNPDSRVALSHARDAFGVPRAVIDWRLSSRDRDTAVAMTKELARAVSQLKLGTLRAEPWLEHPGEAWKAHFSDAYHHAGTTRMAADPADGVVNTDLAVFDTAGLYLCGGSVFRTSGYANPTLTIVALAFRLADHLRQSLGSRN
jgi:choline dehydrogenase-like flavoprotein